MAQIFPFNALRYNAGRVPLQDVVTQPYDKITPEMQHRYYQAHPQNLVRLILGRSETGDRPGHDVYSRAAHWLRQWREESILIPDPAPAIYRYSQRFRVPGSIEERERVGFVALGKLEDYDRGIILRHELTMTGPKADRLALLRATRAQLEQLFMVYSDPEGRIDRLLAPAGGAEIDVTDEYGVQHRVWRITEPKILDAVTAEMSSRKIIIADGHHRYETALTYRDERRKENPNAGPNAPWERTMMTFVNMDAPGLVILPGHRVVHSLEKFESGWFVLGTRQHFKFEQINGKPSAEELTRWLAEHRSPGNMAAVTKDGAWTMQYLPNTTGHLMGTLSPHTQMLDVAILHRVVLETMLGISPEDIRTQKHVNFLRDAAEAVARVRDGNANVAFLINPCTMQEVRDISFAGETMPQKSTDFYPKLLSGLTMYAME